MRGAVILQQGYCIRLRWKDTSRAFTDIMKIPYRKYIHNSVLPILLLLLLACTLAACGYMRNVFIRGMVTDISGQALPGVVVRVTGTEFGALTNALGRYSLGAAPGHLQLEFMKTGYTPVRTAITVDTIGIVEAAPVALWPLPMGEGVYLFQNYRYYQTTYPRPNRYKVEEQGGVAVGTPVCPELRIHWEDPEYESDRNPPVLIGHKMPAYDARMNKMRRVNAALIHEASRSRTSTENAGNIQYHEEIWIADQPVPLRSRILDEAERLLVELRPIQALEPGVYAIHWGALEGYDSIEPRIFLFEIEAPPEDVEGEDAGEGENDEGEETPS